MDLIQPGNWDSNNIDPAVEAKVAEYVDVSKLSKGHIMQRIERGRQGLNVGIKTMVEHIDKYTYGVHAETYYLIGADSSAGKTTLTDFMYVLNAYWQAKLTGRKLYIFYYSFEIGKERKMLRWISYFVQVMYGVTIPSTYIDGKIHGLPLSDEHLKMVRYATVYVEEMMNDIVFVEDSYHPTKIFHDMIEGHYEIVGKVIRNKPADSKKKGTIIGWEPNDPMAITLVIMDHIALLGMEQGFDTKQTMDLMSKYFVTLRNIFGCTPVVIQQFNTEMTSYHRMNRKGDALIAPQRIDFGDSRYTYRDADVVLGLIKPSMYDVDVYNGYDIKSLRGYMVAAHLMKNRDGTDHRVLPLFVNPIAGFIKCLPLTPDIEIAMDPFIREVKEIEKLVQFFTPKAA